MSDEELRMLLRNRRKKSHPSSLRAGKVGAAGWGERRGTGSAL